MYVNALVSVCILSCNGLSDFLVFETSEDSAELTISEKLSVWAESGERRRLDREEL